MPKSDLVGKRFGKLVVIEECGRNNHKQVLWKCKCDCGNKEYVIATTNSLNSGRVVSCGCRKKKDLTGERFGKLVALYPTDKKTSSRQIIWKFRCDCGREVEKVGASVSFGHVRSCGMCRNEYLESVIVDYSNMEFDGFKVIKRFPTTETKSVPYLCKCNYCGNEFIVTDHALRQNCVHSCGCTYGSRLELEVYNYIRSVKEDIKIYRQYNIFNDKREVDIYLPDYKLAIEVNGSFIHSSEGNRLSSKSHNYHFNKFLDAKKNNIRLITIFDIDWGDKVKDIIRDIISSKNKVFARNCICKEIDKKESNLFFDKYHLYGGNNMSNYNYGLYYNNDLVSVMSFGKRRYKDGIEIIRYAIKSGYTIIGGADKLFKHFVNDYNISEVMTYSDNDYFDGSIYERLGFSFDGYTNPDYYWYNEHKGYLNREKCQPKILKEKYPYLYNPDSNSVENYIMIKLGYVKVYRCGNTRWIWRR